MTCKMMNLRRAQNAAFAKCAKLGPNIPFTQLKSLDNSLLLPFIIYFLAFSSACMLNVYVTITPSLKRSSDEVI